MSFNDTTSNDASSVAQFKSFVSEAELEERRRVRQEEWEKVRKPDQPLEAPEEEFDHRSLYDRLQEQKEKRQAEYEETHKLKHLIRGLDDDEVAFLDLVDKTKMEMESKISKEDKREIEEYREAVAMLSGESSVSKVLEPQRKKTATLCHGQSSSRKSQLSLLSTAIKRKSSESDQQEEKKHKMNQVNSGNQSELSDPSTSNNNSNQPSQDRFETNKSQGDSSSEGMQNKPSGLVCIGVLPGVGVYSDSSDSEDSSSSDTEDGLDILTPNLLGRAKLKICGNTVKAVP
ncbi:PSME3-interacting protein [Tachypleus tridentatus]|uniref:PSME3-interacting protein n=1 Tax=Tachypleus tridentatus TaxID=6853 RepID=UPI003FD552D8